MIDSPLYGLRILHYLNPVRYDTTGRFQSEFDSNYKVVEKTISFLPMRTGVPRPLLLKAIAAFNVFSSSPSAKTTFF